MIDISTAILLSLGSFLFSVLVIIAQRKLLHGYRFMELVGVLCFIAVLVSSAIWFLDFFGAYRYPLLLSESTTAAISLFSFGTISFLYAQKIIEEIIRRGRKLELDRSRTRDN